MDQRALATRDGLKASVNGQLTAEDISCHSNTGSRKPLAIMLYDWNKAEFVLLLRLNKLDTRKQSRQKQAEQTKKYLFYSSGLPGTRKSIQDPVILQLTLFMLVHVIYPVDLVSFYIYLTLSSDVNGYFMLLFSCIPEYLH